MGINSGKGVVEADDRHKCVQNGGIGETRAVVVAVDANAQGRVVGVKTKAIEVR